MRMYPGEIKKPEPEDTKGFLKNFWVSISTEMFTTESITFSTASAMKFGECFGFGEGLAKPKPMVPRMNDLEWARSSLRKNIFTFG